MAKVTLEFDSYEDAEELKDAMDGTKNAAIIDEIWSQCFRPAFKHGYSVGKIQELIEMDIMEYKDENGESGNYALDLIDMISDIYRDVARDE